jgi:hypothetical protein
MTDDPTPGPGLTPVDVPVFPGLARAFGYPGGARFVRFFWEPCGDEVLYDDGRRSGTGDPYAFLAYRKHPAVLPLLRPDNLGSSDHCLLFDQEQGAAFVCPTARGRALVRDQHPEPEPPTPYEAEEALRDFETAWREVEVPREEIARAMKERHEAVTRMIARLDGWQAHARNQPREP